MVEHQNSSVGNHLGELYNQIHLDQQAVDAAKENVKQAEAALEKTKTTFANYLKERGIDKLLAPAQQQELFASTPGTTRTVKTGAVRKPRTSSADKASEVERNKAIYTGSYPLGLNEKTGLPVRYKGRGAGNDAINAQMADDLRDFEAKNAAGGEPVAAQEPEAPVAPAAKATKKK